MWTENTTFLWYIVSLVGASKTGPLFPRIQGSFIVTIKLLLSYSWCVCIEKWYTLYCSLMMHESPPHAHKTPKNRDLQTSIRSAWNLCLAVINTTCALNNKARFNNYLIYELRTWWATPKPICSALLRNLSCVYSSFLFLTRYRLNVYRLTYKSRKKFTLNYLKINTMKPQLCIIVCSVKIIGEYSVYGRWRVN